MVGLRGEGWVSPVEGIGKRRGNSKRSEWRKKESVRDEV